MSHNSIIVSPGDRFGRLTVIAEAPRHTGTEPKRRFFVRCDCGVEKSIQLSRLRMGANSCGCDTLEKIRASNTKHGHSGSPEYRVFRYMISRCENPNTEAWKNYGGRGITVCEEWRHDFLAFLAHVGRRPTPKHTIERIKNDRGYEPGNVEWATRDKQARNSRRNIWIEHKGERRLLEDVTDEVGINNNTVIHRRLRGWPESRLLEPPRPWNSSKKHQSKVFIMQENTKVKRDYFMDSGLFKSYPATGISGELTGAINQRFRAGLKCARCHKEFNDGDVAKRESRGFYHVNCQKAG